MNTRWSTIHPIEILLRSRQQLVLLASPDGSRKLADQLQQNQKDRETIPRDIESGALSVERVSLQDRANQVAT